MTHPTGDALRAASTGPRALLASLTDEAAEVVVAMARWAAEKVYPISSVARRVIARLRGEGA